MKINVVANDFCPNDCKYYEQETIVLFTVANEVGYTENRCKNRKLCAYAHSLKNEVTG